MASQHLVDFAENLHIPVATTFMAKGAIPFSHPLSLGTVGLQVHDHVALAFDRADVIICVGYDMVEYAPHLWHKSKSRSIIHIDATPAEVDEYYVLAAGVVGRQERAATNYRSTRPRGRSGGNGTKPAICC